jgi:hypothetical protein
MLSHHPTLRNSVFCILAVFAAMPVWAGWDSQFVLGTSAYQGTIAIDSAGNLTAVWFQYQTPSGGAVNQIWASTAAFGQPWSVPVNISGTISVSGGSSQVRTSAGGKATAIYTDPTLGAAFVDHTAGGTWGTPGTTHGVNQFYASNGNGDDGLAWGVGATRQGAGVTSIAVVQRPAGGAWGSAATTIASGAHLNLDGALLAPSGTMAVAWESFDAVCGSRTCKTSNWALHVSTRAAGGSWVDSGVLLGPSATQHFGQLAGDSAGDLGLATTSGGNLVSLVRHGTSWTGPVVIASSSAITFSSGVITQNRVFASDSAGHATFVGFNGPNLLGLAAVDGNLTTNTWGTVQTITGADQFPNYFDFAMSSTGKAIAFYALVDQSSNTTWRGVTRSGPGLAWSAPATAGTSFEGGGVPEGVALNAAGQAAVLFHGLSADFLTNIEYTNTFQP